MSLSKPGFAHALVAWYREGHRQLPWRKTRDPYRLWLSEVMLQQTQAATVVDYFERFLTEFPTIEALAAAPQQQVLKLWEGLGYYARCRNLHKAARRIVEDHGGRFPAALNDVIELPGVGRSTAGAILTFAFDQRHPLLDGNVVRVISRLYDFEEVVSRAAPRRQLWSWSQALLDQTDTPTEFNQAIMELGATVCGPRRPVCGECPVAGLCSAFTAGTVDKRPVKKPRKRTPHHDVSVGVIWRDREVLIQRRRQDGLLGGLWEFPGGRCRAGESRREAVSARLRERLGIEVSVRSKLAAIDHAFSHFRITLHAYECSWVSGEPRPSHADEARWIDWDSLADFAFPKANGRVVDLVLAEEGRA